MATNLPATGADQQTGPDLAKMIDLAAKSAFIFAAVLYGCGFLVTSIHQYNYGLVAVNPLRPKVLAAGIWLLVFVTIPFVLVMQEGEITPSKPEHEQWQRRRSTTFFFSAAAEFGIGVVLSNAFNLPPDGPKGPSLITICLVLIVGVILVFADQLKQFPHWLAVSGSVAFGGIVMYCGFRDAFIWHRPSAAFIALWFIAATYLVTLEIRYRSWKFKLGYWIQCVSFSIGAVTAFSTAYYPNIKPSWGGGSPIPATIYFTKDSLIMPSQSVAAKIIDETDGGFYIIGGSDTKATFIPRSAVAMVYYSDDSKGAFITKSK
jgi:hypothetical protein